MAHLESCEPCAKFHHQLQQVILAAEEVPLPDEMLPQKEEQLARLIMQQLPAPKSSPLAFLTNFFGKFKNGKTAAATSSSAFPHRTTMPADEPNKQSEPPTFHRPPSRHDLEYDHSGTNTRLKAMKSMFDNEADRLYESNRDAQSGTLGGKFGVTGVAPISASISSEVDVKPLTLAESIRRKISESGKPPGSTSGPLEAVQLGPEESSEQQLPVMATNEQSDWRPQATTGGAEPPAGMPPYSGSTDSTSSSSIKPAGQTVLGSWGKPTPIDSGTWTPTSRFGADRSDGDTDGGATSPPADDRSSGSWGPGWDTAANAARPSGKPLEQSLEGSAGSNNWGGHVQSTPMSAPKSPNLPSPSANQQVPIQPIASPDQLAAPDAPSAMPAAGASQPGPGWGPAPSPKGAGGAKTDPWGGTAGSENSWSKTGEKAWGQADTGAPAQSAWGPPKSGSWDSQSGDQGSWGKPAANGAHRSRHLPGELQVTLKNGVCQRQRTKLVAALPSTKQALLPHSTHTTPALAPPPRIYQTRPVGQMSIRPNSVEQCIRTGSSQSRSTQKCLVCRCRTNRDRHLESLCTWH